MHRVSVKEIFAKSVTALLVAFSLVSAQQNRVDSLQPQVTSESAQSSSAADFPQPKPALDSLRPAGAADVQQLQAASDSAATGVLTSLIPAPGNPQDFSDSRQIQSVPGSEQPSGVVDSNSAGMLPSAIQDSATSLLDSLQAEPGNVENGGLPLQAAENLSGKSTAKDSVPRQTSKVVLYLSGGEHSAWYHLGVLYALESYSIPVDSVVGTSWGALVGYLWAKGISLDDIQRLLLDKSISEAVGHNAMDDFYKGKKSSPNVPVSVNGIPSLRYRFTLMADTNGHVYRDVKNLEPDSLRISENIARVQLQGIINRAYSAGYIPFRVFGSSEKSTADIREQVFKTLPLAGNDSNGEVTSFIAVPAEENPNVVSIIAVAVPNVQTAGNTSWKSPWQKVIAENSLQSLRNQPGIVVRAYSVAENSRNAWIQAGFSAVERRLGELTALRTRTVDYSSQKRKVKLSATYEPAYDSLSAELQSTVKTYWNPSDSLTVALNAFAYGLSRFPAVDSVGFQESPKGDLFVNASIRPTFDLAVGGFGSNAIGPNAYAEAAFHYIDQMEIELSLSGFYGISSYGVRPHLLVSRLWSKNWGLAVDYRWEHLQLLKSYANSFEPEMRINAIEKSEIDMSLYYQIDSRQRISARFLFGERDYDLEKSIYGDDEYATYPAYQSISYRFANGDTSVWFSRVGFVAHAEMGLYSLGYDFGFNEIVPTFIRGYGDLQYTVSPKSFFTLSATLAGAFDLFHKEGYGYVYPETMGYGVLDNCIRNRIRATPWTSEWIDPELSSHHYGLARISSGLHYRGSGLWLFGAYIRDFEENPTATLGVDKFVLEPALRFTYKSLHGYIGMSRIVATDSFNDLKKVSDYSYFIRIGNYEF